MDWCGECMADIDGRIKQAEDRVKQLKARKQKMVIRKKVAENKRLRQEDTRRKILLGAYVLETMRKDESANRRMLEKLEGYLTREDDRALFGLTPKTPAPELPQT